MTRGLYRGELTEAQVRDLAPLVFDGVRGGDAASIGIADAMADEVVAFATAAIRRLHLTRTDVPVVLAGPSCATAPTWSWSAYVSGYDGSLPGRASRCSRPPR